MMEIMYLLESILMPEASSYAKKAGREDLRLIYYTSAETAQKILESSEIWLRNASIMNDRKEILHGIEMIQTALQSSAGKQLGEMVDQVFPRAWATVNDAIQDQQSDWISETYIACLSEHNEREDKDGRLSMWKSYGNVAFVIRTDPMEHSTINLGVFSTPALYMGVPEATDRIERLTKELLNTADGCFKHFNSETFCEFAFEIMRYFAVAIKHPQFREEREVRLYFHPVHRPSPAMEKKIVTVDGVPQPVWALPLRHLPEKGLFGADIPSLLDHIIVGPMENQQICGSALVDLLTAAGVENARKKVVFSDIPLRVG